MTHDLQQHHRRSIRMSGYDYTQPGAYFVTICTHGHTCLFDDPVLRRVVETYWQAIPQHARHVALDAWVLMPNHLHGIVMIQEPEASVGARHSELVLPPQYRQRNMRGRAWMAERARNASPLHAAPAGSLGAIVGTFKAVTARRINSIHHTPGADVWQRNYYEHVVRNEQALQRVREYISNNPLSWNLDIENPANVQRSRDIDAKAYYGAIWHDG